MSRLSSWVPESPYAVDGASRGARWRCRRCRLPLATKVGASLCEASTLVKLFSLLSWTLGGSGLRSAATRVRKGVRV